VHTGAGIALWPVGTPVVPGSSGRLLPGIRARITDPETGGDLAPGQAGELWVRTPALITGYLGNPAASAATVDEDGWLHTGDIARFDTDGSLFLLDRARGPARVLLGGAAARNQARRPGAHLDAAAWRRRDGRGSPPAAGWQLAVGDRSAGPAVLTGRPGERQEVWLDPSAPRRSGGQGRGPVVPGQQALVE
jgi:hypothetical protein